jgi:hypothetical protein
VNEFIDALIQSINMNKNEISSAGTRPLVSAIVQRAQDIVNTRSESTGVVVLAAPDYRLVSQYFKGWKAEDFERLATELEKLKT